MTHVTPIFHHFSVLSLGKQLDNRLLENIIFPKSPTPKDLPIVTDRPKNPTGRPQALADLGSRAVPPLQGEEGLWTSEMCCYHLLFDKLAPFGPCLSPLSAVFYRCIRSFTDDVTLMGQPGP